MRHAARTDANQKEIVDVLRQYGRTVQILAAVGKGCPDLLVGFQGVNYLLEVKVEKGDLTEDQIEWISKWQGQIMIVRNPEEALRATRKEEIPSSTHGPS